MNLKRTKVISPEHPNRSTALFGGEASGILNWNDLRTPRMYELREIIRSTFWSYSDVNLSNDQYDDPVYLQEKMSEFIVNSASQLELQNAIAHVASDASVKSIFGTLLDQTFEHIHAIQNLLHQADLSITENEVPTIQYEVETVDGLLQTIHQLIDLKSQHDHFNSLKNERAPGLHQLMAKIMEERVLHIQFLKELANFVAIENNRIIPYQIETTKVIKDEPKKSFNFDDFDDL